MKYFVLLSGILFTCFCTLTYLAKVTALGNSTLQENLLGATAAIALSEETLGAKSSGTDIDVTNRIDRLEEQVNRELGKLDGRVTALEAKL